MEVTSIPPKYGPPVLLEPGKVSIQLTKEEAEILFAAMHFVGGADGGPFASALLRAMNRAGFGDSIRDEFTVADRGGAVGIFVHRRGA